MPRPSRRIIEASQVSRRFGRIRALDEIDLAINEGEIFGLVGPDGGGKTTLLQILAAILDPSKGRCQVLGFDTVSQAKEVTSRIGYMAQGFTLYDRLTVAENIAFAAKVRGVPTGELAPRRDRLVAMAGLAPFLHRRESQLSGGMRKKLALCTNLIHQPRLLLLDEPGLGVDPLSRRELWRMLEDFRRQGATIVFSTSYMDEAEKCDRLMFLDGGRLIALGTPDELRARAKGGVFRLRAKNIDKADAALRTHGDVLGVEHRAGAIYFIVDPANAQNLARREELGHLGKIEPAAPTIEDVFVVMRGGQDRSDEAVSDATPFTGTPLRISARFAIETRDLTRRFGGFIAVDAVSFKVGSGEIFGLLGANGAGKTTLIRMLCGLLPPSRGSARIADIDVGTTPLLLRRHIGYMSQRFSLYPDLTVAENLAFFASAYGLRGSAAREAMSWASTVTGIEGIADEPVSRLSGAVRQRLALSCSVLHRPAVLFLDEPTSGIDPLSRFRFWRLVEALAAGGTTVLVTTHYLQEANYCHRLGLMHEGRLIALGTLAELRSQFPSRTAGNVEDLFIAFIERERGRDKAAHAGESA